MTVTELIALLKGLNSDEAPVLLLGPNDSWFLDPENVFQSEDGDVFIEQQV